MRVLAAAFAAAAFCATASADETFEFTFQGTGFHLYNAWECPGTICTTPGYSFWWSGTVTVETIAAADGLYTAGDLLSVSLQSNQGGFTVDGFGHVISSAGSHSPVVVPTFATISGGEVTAVRANGSFPPDYRSYNLDGLTATYHFGGCHHCGIENASAVLVAVPEPGTYALMLAGLGALGLMARRAKRDQRFG